MTAHSINTSMVLYSSYNSIILIMSRPIPSMLPALIPIVTNYWVEFVPENRIARKGAHELYILLPNLLFFLCESTLGNTTY